MLTKTKSPIIIFRFQKKIFEKTIFIFFSFKLNQIICILDRDTRTPVELSTIILPSPKLGQNGSWIPEPGWAYSQRCSRMFSCVSQTERKISRQHQFRIRTCWHPANISLGPNQHRKTSKISPPPPNCLIGDQKLGWLIKISKYLNFLLWKFLFVPMHKIDFFNK